MSQPPLSRASTILPLPRARSRRIFGKRPHPPSRNLVYKPIVDQNNDTRPKAKEISVRKNLPLSNNQPQAVEKGECSKASINNALPANPFSASGDELEEGEICVDLTGFGGSNHSHTSSSSEDSLPDSLTGSWDEDEDKSNDGHDKYIEVISKRVIKARRDQNQIVFFIDDNDIIIDDVDAIKAHAVRYYQDMLGGCGVAFDIPEPDCCRM
ncbi:hypothetical protein F2Q70_00040540 [Brassica cretica]|uniref:Uncharacterized protein n=1 Tax=Brassica cretica TaxID=69181 RepID=A0A8S9K6P1_BRACR|nr:hypothetical protein F2Q70_00040540 [Brassica cretica]